MLCLIFLLGHIVLVTELMAGLGIFISQWHVTHKSINVIASKRVIMYVLINNSGKFS
jgi:hypothetical protein